MQQHTTPSPGGLVLGAGGSRGAFLIGAHKALQENGFRFDTITGTSVGALCGAILAQGDADLAWQLWENLTFSDVIGDEELPLETLFLKESRPDTFLEKIKALTALPITGMDIAPLKRLLRETIDEERVRNSGVRFGLVAVNLSDRCVEYRFIDQMEPGTLHDWLLASAYMPVFRREKLMGKDFIDGCYADALPWRMQAESGVTNLTMIHIPGGGWEHKQIPPELNVLHIEPSEPLATKLGFHYRLTRRMLTLGYLDALRALGKTSGQRYYIRRETVPAEQLAVLPEMETQAEIAGIERLQLYSFAEWEQALREVAVLSKTQPPKEDNRSDGKKL